MPPNGCSGGMDALAVLVNKYIRRSGTGLDGRGRPLAFTGCCDEHDLFYEQGGGWRDRAFADKVLRVCIKENLKRRKRGWWVVLHVPWVFWFFVRVCGWWFWGDGE